MKKMHMLFLYGVLLISCTNQNKSVDLGNHDTCDINTQKSGEFYSFDTIVDVGLREIEPCDSFWWNNFDLKKHDDGLISNYFNSVINSKSSLSGLEFQDSIFEFALYLDSIRFNEKSSKISYYYFHKIKPYSDGALSEFLSDLYWDLFDTNPCEFYQVMMIEKKYFKNEWRDITMELELIGQDCAYKEQNSIGYIQSLKNQHMKLFEEQIEIQDVVNEVFEYISAF